MLSCKTIYLKTVDSTNTYAKNHTGDFDKGTVTCITANEQTGGRGRLQRSWLSPKDVNIYATFYLQIPSHTLHISSVGLVLAISLAKLLLKKGLKPQIKWPNDLLLNKKKISGILCETSFKGDVCDLFVGIGINVNMKKDICDKLDKPASSLSIETNKKWDKNLLLEELQKEFLQDIEIFLKSGFTHFHTEAENLLAYRGEKITFFDGKNTYSGILHSLNQEGLLNLFLPNGEMITLTSGDVAFNK